MLSKLYNLEIPEEDDIVVGLYSNPNVDENYYINMETNRVIDVFYDDEEDY